MKSILTLAKRRSKPSSQADSDSQFDTDRSASASISGASSYIEQPDRYGNESRTTVSIDPSSSIHGAWQVPPSIHVRDPKPSARLSRQIASVCCLLRDMYSLDLKIFGTTGGRPEDAEKRIAMITDADALFRKVLVTLDAWGTEENSRMWTEEEVEMIHRIRMMAHLHDPRHHRKLKGHTV